MTNFIPIFPLNIVVYPGESLHLHIFEPRYKQLIDECCQEQKPFGIPAVINNQVGELGTLVNIKEIAKRYDNGEMDIKASGIKVFRILEVVKTIPNKLYSGAIVTYPENNEELQITTMQKVVNNLRQLHMLMQVQKDFKKPDADLLSYDIAHHAGMSLEEEYELLGLMKEIQRLEYLKRHIKKAQSVLDETENLKHKIKLNGHFKELKGFNFEND
ncbi:MAG: LON peptidase substrate-binding domain-containing protein [Sphingobacteriia bacterium]|nr:LON peptidase substrate-binding domain-containing protein [Sphingobacteriia bacterium]